MSVKTILVVDDEAHITHVVSLKLRNAGFEVLTAKDGEEGCELAIRSQPDLIITDLQMPYMTGVEMCAKLKENASTSMIPALMLTARGYSLEKGDLNRTNIKGVLSKPFSPREVLDQVKKMLDQPASESGASAEAA